MSAGEQAVSGAAAATGSQDGRVRFARCRTGYYSVHAHGSSPPPSTTVLKESTPWNRAHDPALRVAGSWLALGRDDDARPGALCHHDHSSVPPSLHSDAALVGSKLAQDKDDGAAGLRLRQHRRSRGPTARRRETRPRIATPCSRPRPPAVLLAAARGPP